MNNTNILNGTQLLPYYDRIKGMSDQKRKSNSTSQLNQKRLYLNAQKEKLQLTNASINLRIIIGESNPSQNKFVMEKLIKEPIKY